MEVVDGSEGLAGEEIGLETRKEERERKEKKISLRGNENMGFRSIIIT